MAQRLLDSSVGGEKNKILENLYSPASDSYVGLQRSLEEEDGERNRTLKSRRPYILRDLYRRLAANQSEGMGEKRTKHEAAVKRQKPNRSIDNLVFYPSFFWFGSYGSYMCQNDSPLH